MALSVPLSRFTSRVGGGSAFFVRRHCASYEAIAITALCERLLCVFQHGVSWLFSERHSCHSDEDDDWIASSHHWHYLRVAGTLFFDLQHRGGAVVILH